MILFSLHTYPALILHSNLQRITPHPTPRPQDQKENGKKERKRQRTSSHPKSIYHQQHYYPLQPQLPHFDLHFHPATLRPKSNLADGHIGRSVSFSWTAFYSPAMWSLISPRTLYQNSHGGKKSWKTPTGGLSWCKFPLPLFKTRTHRLLANKAPRRTKAENPSMTFDLDELIPWSEEMVSAEERICLLIPC